MKRISIVLLVFTVFALKGEQVEAYRTKPASACQVADNQAAFKLNRSRIQNVSTSAELQVDCPIVSSRSGFDSSRAYVRVRDVHPTRDVHCTFVKQAMLDHLGSDFGILRTRKTNGSSALEQNLYSGIVSLTDFPSFAYYYATCSVPRAYVAHKADPGARSEVLVMGSSPTHPWESGND